MYSLQMNRWINVFGLKIRATTVRCLTFDVTDQQRLNVPSTVEEGLQERTWSRGASGAWKKSPVVRMSAK